MGAGKSAGIKNAVDAINEVECDTCILLENEAGQKNSIGSDLQDMAEILDLLAIKNKGFCLDTCHAFAAGYDIRDVSATNEIKNILGFDKIKAIHLNDALYNVGSHRDRHANFGMGFIGLNGFRQFFKEKKLLSKPMIMETPDRYDMSPAEELRTVKYFLEECR
jgi:deoxyribonuclease-4